LKAKVFADELSYGVFLHFMVRLTDDRRWTTGDRQWDALWICAMGCAAGSGLTVISGVDFEYRFVVKGD